MSSKTGFMNKWPLIVLTLLVVIPITLFSIGCTCDEEEETRRNDQMRAMFARQIELQNQRTQLQEQANTQTSTIQTLQTQLTSLKSEAQAVQSGSAPVQKEADSLQQQQTEAQRIDQQIKDKQAEIAQANQKLNEIDKQMQTVQASLDAIFKVNTSYGSSSSRCFAGDTLVLMADNSLKKISDIQVGEAVWSYNESSGQVVAAEVIATGNGEASYYYLINGNLKVTPPHPFFTTGGQWVKVEDLAVGDKIKSNSGVTEITSIELVNRGQQIFNIFVKNYQNFFVSADGENLYLVREQ